MELSKSAALRYFHLQGLTAIAQRFEPVLILADCIQVTIKERNSQYTMLLLYLLV